MVRTCLILTIASLVCLGAVSRADGGITEVDGGPVKGGFAFDSVMPANNSQIYIAPGVPYIGVNVSFSVDANHYFDPDGTGGFLYVRTNGFIGGNTLEIETDASFGGVNLSKNGAKFFSDEDIQYFQIPSGVTAAKNPELGKIEYKSGVFSNSTSQFLCGPGLYYINATVIEMSPPYSHPDPYFKQYFVLTSTFTVTSHPTPEPSMLTFLAIGGVGIMAYGWRRFKQNDGPSEPQHAQ